MCRLVNHSCNLITGIDVGRSDPKQGQMGRFSKN
jgi:hypothetical protein